MKTASDLIQVAIGLPGVLGYVACVAVVFLCLYAIRGIDVFAGAVYWIAGRVWRFIKVGPFGLLSVCVVAIPVFIMRGRISEGLQYIEQMTAPAYLDSDTSAHATAIYEAEIYRHCDQYEAAIVINKTREIARKVGCSPLAIYEVAYSECGLNPFRVRDDGVAAGFIQFTTKGLPGIMIDGKQATLADVKAACRARDVSRIMDMTEQYLVSRSKGLPLVDACGVYTCVFAPGYVGSNDDQVLYSLKDDGAYYLENIVFDGYYIDSSGRIMHSNAARDGRITKRELGLHLAAKKWRLLSSRKYQ